MRQIPAEEREEPKTEEAPKRTRKKKGQDASRLHDAGGFPVAVRQVESDWAQRKTPARRPGSLVNVSEREADQPGAPQPYHPGAACWTSAAVPCVPRPPALRAPAGMTPDPWPP